MTSCKISLFVLWVVCFHYTEFKPLFQYRLLFWKPREPWHCVWFDPWTDAQGISCQRQIRTGGAAKFHVKNKRLGILSEATGRPACPTPFAHSPCAVYAHTPPVLAQRRAPDAPVPPTDKWYVKGLNIKASLGTGSHSTAFNWED